MQLTDSRLKSLYGEKSIRSHVPIQDNTHTKYTWAYINAPNGVRITIPVFEGSTSHAFHRATAVFGVGFHKLRGSALYIGQSSQKRYLCVMRKRVNMEKNIRFRN
jgi:hypothetical protein